ncbi:hypothetical protein NYP18_08965 [Corynebacterium sp. YIM 101645]|uniref:Secreted protein n=1 Tax=Corynebacterium lemuris TaxID=1859292 RepID=A0ABT2FX24_9CORY|nr:hypothetical protein [Corynebacterium lemuris]MCS5479789.1 hypothetical protein [Corynebacterium lemuris]
MSLDIIIGVVWVPMILLALYGVWHVVVENRELAARLDGLDESFGKMLDIIDEMNHVLSCAHSRSHVAVDALQAHLNGEDVEIQVHKMPLRTTDREE